MRRPLTPTSVLVLLVTAGCAQRVPPPVVTPSSGITALDARRASHPRDPEVLTEVGVEFYQAGEYARAA